MFTYIDGSGNKKLRGYVKFALGALVILIALVGVNLFNHHQMVSEVMAAPRPLDASQLPAPTQQGAAPVVPVEQCPSNPGDWTLTNSVSAPDSNLKGLAPQCVYDQLDKTAAWLYATRVFGYSRFEAANLFGFSSIPMKYQLETGQITVVTDFKSEPQKVDLTFPHSNPNLQDWLIDPNGNPAVEFTFSGCFRTTTMNGGEVVSWGDGYPVVCQYFLDSHTTYYVGDINGNVVTAGGPAEHVRRTIWFGYNGNGNWVFLGVAKNWDVDFSKIQNPGASTINPIVMAQEYGITSKPLPENWITFTGKDYVDAYLKELK